MAFRRLFGYPRKSGIINKICNRSSQNFSTAGIIVIGDEILKGEVLDTNSHFLTSELHTLGVKVQKISIIADDINEISNEVKAFSNRFTYVITTGGIGPTHDDVTFEGVAKAFNEPLVTNNCLKELCLEYYKTDHPESPGMKLARIPKSAKLNFATNKPGSKIYYPNISMKNVFMFPGIPELLEKSFTKLGQQLFKSDGKFYSKCVYFNVTEDKIAKALDELLQEFPNVQFGSYPKLFNEYYKVKITIESPNEKATSDAYQRLLELMPKETIVDKFE